MPPVCPPDRRPDDCLDNPLAWFSDLLIARDRADFRRAAAAQRELARLGWSVVCRQPRPRRDREGGGR